jgi:hypothetical protein
LKVWIGIVNQNLILFAQLKQDLYTGLILENLQHQLSKLGRTKNNVLMQFLALISQIC